MTGNKSLDRFLDFCNSNASGVISTITNQQLTFRTTQYNNFDYAVIEKNLSLPSVVATIEFSGTFDFQILIMISKNVVAMFADLMMLGAGDIEYNGEEHNDAMKEMLNQTFGSMTTELNVEGINASGIATSIKLDDLRQLKEALADAHMAEISFELLGIINSLYFILNEEALSAIEKLFKISTKHTTNPVDKKSNSKQEPVRVSRASFAEMEEIGPSNSKNINLDNLMDIPLPVSVELGRKEMRIKEILDLGQGAIVELNKLAGDLVDLYVNGKKFAVGEVMVVEENYAVRIVNLISREERIRSLGPE